MIIIGGFGVLGFWGFGPKARIHNKSVTDLSLAYLSPLPLLL